MWIKCVRQATLFCAYANSSYSHPMITRVMIGTKNKAHGAFHIGTFQDIWSLHLGVLIMCAATTAPVWTVMTEYIQFQFLYKLGQSSATLVLTEISQQLLNRLPWWSPDFSSSATVRVTFQAFSEISRLLLKIFLLRHQQVDIETFMSQMNSNNFGWSLRGPAHPLRCFHLSLWLDVLSLMLHRANSM